ncbi:methyl-accepting chemotaxis protein [Roseospira visakhapatnamensis]|uniref:Methyl-accepting chemotaxis protein n=1 Tax=Roseospira visakhapatnamensis TaxID=390880 RepID=A0A7W6RAJ1_9PROT|nr:nitrate- and nitrite sensing domain-containing protein [Roseospira visakhapatnamensis]MBB4264985.1 methyl-accepting chemotaxis protein [Roseospira visakhapatnamensis]
MSRFFASMRIGPRLLLALSLPLAGLMIFAGLSVFDRVQVASDMGRLSQLAHLAPTVSQVVHELQRERGASAGFLGDPEGRFRSTLLAQKTDSDTAVADLTEALRDVDDTALDPAFRRDLHESVQGLDGLQAMRRRVNGQSVGVDDMAAFYTGTIAHLLDIIEQMALLSPDAGISRRITAYIAFLHAKERAGIERAMGANGFSSGAFSPVVYRRFLDLIGQQKAYLATFRGLATAEERAALSTVLDGEAARAVDGMRDVAATSVTEGGTRDVTGARWFDTITRKIDGLKGVEDLLAEDLLHAMEVTGHAAWVGVWITLSVAVVLMVVTVLVVMSIAVGITRPVRAMTTAMGRLATKDYSTEIPAQDREDEIGDMAKAVVVFKDRMVRVDELTAWQTEETQKREDRARRIEDLNGTFDRGVRGILDSVTGATTQLQATAESMTAIADRTNSQATTVATAAEAASVNVQTVASAAEELSASIGEIGRQVQQANDIARTAADEAARTNEVVSGLADAAETIGQIVSLITDIADQTNLLALNATIEAARAGDAGKGFAVVANEVKSLATQTAKATEEIGQQIGAVQTETQTAVSAIESIATIIGRINEVTSTIASAVEQQSAATQEIARNVQQASTGTNEVSQTIVGVTDAAREAGAAADTVLQASGGLGEQSQQLSTLVRRFLEDARAIRSSR